MCYCIVGGKISKSLHGKSHEEHHPSGHPSVTHPSPDWSLYTVVLPESFRHDKTSKVILTQETNSIISRQTHPEKTNHNVGNAHSSYSHASPLLEEKEVQVTLDVPVSMVDAATEEDRTTLAPGWWLRVVSMLHSVTMCSTMDTGQLRIRCKLSGTNLYSSSVQTMAGQDISDELQNKIPVMLTELVHTPEILARHAI
jgi:hypothetical protein